jgi:hypothetical protein
MSDPTQIDIEANVRFLKLLDTVEHTFQVFDDDSDRDDKSLAKIRHGTLTQHADFLRRCNNDLGCGVFVTVNETDGKGRKAENIIRVRAVYTDLDGAPLEPVMRGRVKPHIVVESSPQRWHCYWLVAGMPLEDFSAVQLAIIERFNSDRSVHDLPRVMRLPGFIHSKVKNGIRSELFVSRIIQAIDGPPYPASYFERAATEVHTPGRRSDVSLLDMWKAATALEVIPNDNLDWADWNRIGMATWAATGGSQYGFDAFDSWSANSQKYYAQRTRRVWKGYERSPPNQLNIGTLIFLADDADPQWRDRMMAEVTALMNGDPHG